ncbi:hypothetical protein MKW98_028931 [Papaver atlanticum]|uniref:Avr9/Cf-9 rapidly elicited protein 146 n=1 Tax=Papaver atlanticum TaxID=357466 RepID=A0AAD4S2M8_9MAGN|nr:hypothetical protein MKW98_028931 [Papaver atlanticum]
MDAKPSTRIVAKRLWSIVRVAFFMIRKGISKNNKSFMLHLHNIMSKGGKIASKLISNLMLFHHPNHSSQVSSSKIPRHYEFSCSNSPAAAAVQKISEMLNNQVMTENGSSTVPSPYLPGLGFGRSPMVRQLRVTDSPFPLRDNVFDEIECHVDEDAEEFIEKCYTQLRSQKNKTALEESYAYNIYVSCN